MLSELDVLQNTVAWQSAFCTPPVTPSDHCTHYVCLLYTAYMLPYACADMLSRHVERRVFGDDCAASQLVVFRLCFYKKSSQASAVKPPPCTNYVTICGEFLEFCFKSMTMWLNCESKQLMWNSVDADGSRFVSFAQLSQLIFILLQTAESKLIPSYCSLSPSGCIEATLKITADCRWLQTWSLFSKHHCK